MNHETTVFNRNIPIYIFYVILLLIRKLMTKHSDGTIANNCVAVKIARPPAARWTHTLLIHQNLNQSDILVNYITQHKLFIALFSVAYM